MASGGVMQLEEFRLQSDRRWGNAPTQEALLPVDAVAARLPRFTRELFRIDQGVNDRMDAIVRLPFGDDPHSVPVAIVSKGYSLLQHADLMEQVVEVLRRVDPETVEQGVARVTLSEYGERWQCAVPLAGQALDPGDGYPIALYLFLRNSVDGSCACELSLRWLRQVCKNGMAVVTAQDRVRGIHYLDRINRLAIEDLLHSRTRIALDAHRVYAEWCATAVTERQLRSWTCNVVAPAWGPHAAARVFKICMTGFDGAVQSPPGMRVEPDQVAVRADTKVPGAAAPARNVYQAYQALTWIASCRPCVDDQDAWGANAVVLTRELSGRHH